MASEVFGDSLASFHDIAFSSYHVDDINKLVTSNQSLPVQVASLKISGAGRRTRHSFLQAQVDSILNAKSAFTLQQLLQELDEVSARVLRFGNYADVRFKLDLASVTPLKALLANQSAPSEENPLLEPYRGIKPLDLKATLYLKLANPHPLKIKTLVRDNGPAAFSTSFALKNLFGGAENLALAYTKESLPSSGSSCASELSVPLSINSPDTRLILSAFKVNKANAFPTLAYAASSLGGSFKLVTQSPIYPSSFAEFGVSAIKREIHGKAPSGTPESSFKTSVFSRFVIDHRTYSPDSPGYINGGHLLDWQTEVAGVAGSEKYAGDVSFLKTQAHAQYSKSLDPGHDNVVFNLAAGSGLLWAYNNKHAHSSSIYDRFFLGGPNGGFASSTATPPGVLLHAYKPSALGPKEGGEPLGSDAFAAGTASVTAKLPRLNSKWATEYLSPLRFVAFFSQANLIPIPHSSEGESLNSQSFADVFKNPTTSGGLGLVYKTPAAQLELVYAAPFVVNDAAKDVVRKGWQVGVGFDLDF